MIKIENLCYSIGKADIIKNISLKINKGDFVAIIGENGAGKSTITKLIAGLIKPSQGTVYLANKDTKKLKAKEIAKTCSYLFQNPDKQICQKTVREELLFSLEILDIDESEKEKRLEDILKIFNIDSSLAPFSLSRGQRQMLTFASVLITKPSVLILDEPTTGLDYKECMLMMDLVKNLNENGTTVIMVSHDMEIVSDFAKSIIVLNKGKLLDFGDTFDIMKKTSVLEKASVMPSQIIALANSLGDDFSSCLTAEDIANIIESRCK
ncbi:MAG: ABC transporter ATP-binding protein [Clostridia bacterium]